MTRVPRPPRPRVPRLGPRSCRPRSRGPRAQGGARPPPSLSASDGSAFRAFLSGLFSPCPDGSGGSGDRRVPRPLVALGQPRAGGLFPTPEGAEARPQSRAQCPGAPRLAPGTPSSWCVASTHPELALAWEAQTHPSEAARLRRGWTASSRLRLVFCLVAVESPMGTSDGASLAVLLSARGLTRAARAPRLPFPLAAAPGRAQETPAAARSAFRVVLPA